VVDDEKLQQLLTKASSLYNGGEYKGAIEAWQEALGVDPSSQKAKEGIRMATLLMGDWEPAAQEAGAGESQEAADGADGGGAELSSEELEAKVDLGIARVKQLLAQRKYSEAVDGARGLLPLSPESGEVQRILEEAQHAFEAVPFIDEHMLLARELMDQERFPEAETEIKKVFTLDAEHPQARALLAEVREKVQGTLKKAADQIGGMTVKLTTPEVLAAAKAKAAAAARPASTPAAPKTPPARSFGNEGDLVLDGADEPSIALAGPGRPKDGQAASTQEEVAARNALDAAFELAGVDQDLPVAVPIDETGASQSKIEHASAPAAGFELRSDPDTPARPGSSEGAADSEVVEARTVVPPSSRVVPRTPAPATAAPKVETVKPAAPKAAASKAATPEAGKPRTAVPAAAAGAPAGKETQAAPAPAAKGPAAKEQVSKPAFDETAWETELAQLNIKQGERNLLKGTPVKSGSVKVDEQADVDLMSALDDDLGGLPEPPAKTEKKEPLGGTEGPSIPLKAESKPPVETPKKKREIVGASTSPDAAPEAAPSARPAAREKPAPLPGPKSRSSLPRLFMLLGLIILAGGAAAWWFLFQPKSAGGAGNPGQPAAPPSSSSPGAASPGGEGTIPTPLGSTSRQPAPAPQNAAATGSAAGNSAAMGDALSAPAGPAALQPPPTGGGAVGGTAPAAQATAPTGAGAATPAAGEPIKPAAPPLSPEEAHRKIAEYLAAGKQLSQAGKWREARAKLGAVLAIDPANFEAKDLADKAQAKVEEDQHIYDDFESAKKFFADKDYENALRKFYRLPRDKDLGDIDVYIRNSWFNWAVMSMRGGNATDVLQKLKELSDVDPDDAEAIKIRDVAEHYVSRAKDRVFYAFTDTLKLRSFDQK